MTRILGVISGAAIAIALLTWLVGVPQFTSERPSDSALVKLVELARPVDAPVPADEPAAGPATDRMANPPAVPATESAPAVTPDTPEPLPDAAVADTGKSSSGHGIAADDPQWFAFWSPFRSEVAASGFVSQLQRVTGLDYRVVKVEPGVYEVAFAYSDDKDIDAYLSTISAATGLDLPAAR